MSHQNANHDGVGNSIGMQHFYPPPRLPQSHWVRYDVDYQTSLPTTVIATVGGVEARIMLGSGAGSSYISSNLLTALNLKPYRTERRVIEQMFR